MVTRIKGELYKTAPCAFCSNPTPRSELFPTQNTRSLFKHNFKRRTLCVGCWKRVAHQLVGQGHDPQLQVWIKQNYTEKFGGLGRGGVCPNLR